MAQWSICNAGGSTVCPLFHMSLPNTFPFTLALSICHWGLPHGVNHVSWWWSRLFCNLLALSCLHLFFTARYNKHRLAFLFFIFFFCSTQRMVHAAAFIRVGRARLSVCIIVCIVVRSGHALFLHLPRVLQLSFLAISLRSVSVMDPH